MPFVDKIRVELAAEVGGICSAPHCGIPTGMPGQRVGNKQNIGDGAHICGSRPDAPRYDENQSDEERESASNGIWLCPSCHRRIDRFIDLHKADVLHRWKQTAIEAYKGRIGRPPLPTGSSPLDSEYAKARAFIAEQQDACKALFNLRWDARGGRIALPSDTAREVRHFFLSNHPRFMQSDYANWCYAPELKARQTEIVRILYTLSERPQFRILPKETVIDFRWEERDGIDRYVDPTASAITCYLNDIDAFGKYLHDCIVPDFGQKSPPQRN
ncbi:HNH endonuclease [Trinickia fusca]|uniref:HNH nuclease domain-containing protein n=1 Tax=Trinickia fusca TaxID=2419777 RepID=A0A494XAE8_9BURK|nr:HNH endonuclease [Trinickia fusca]RKP47528.1 hypothetical protein D7S89_14970 [Trinickia fusca]